jgi:hypothetical protein
MPAVVNLKDAVSVPAVADNVAAGVAAWSTGFLCGDGSGANATPSRASA